jgi:hypothetical protein
MRKNDLSAGHAHLSLDYSNSEDTSLARPKHLQRSFRHFDDFDCYSMGDGNQKLSGKTGS